MVIFHQMIVNNKTISEDMGYRSGILRNINTLTTACTLYRAYDFEYLEYEYQSALYGSPIAQHSSRQARYSRNEHMQRVQFQ